MVCIAAFIVLCLISVFVGILSIFRRDIGSKYWKTFKKAWACVFTKLKFQKCETNFKSDIKNSLLAKVVIKHPKAVKPLGIAIEVGAVLIVLLTIWSLVFSIRAGLSLLVFGNCDMTSPDACSQSSVCVAVEEKGNLGEQFVRWFTGWGEIFAAIPDRIARYDAGQIIEQAEAENANLGFALSSHSEQPDYAIDVFDPGCDKCLQSFRNQIADGFLDRYATAMVPYPMFADGAYKYKSSGILARYLLAAEEWSLTEADTTESSDTLPRPLNWQIAEKLFTDYSPEGVNYQSVFNNLPDEAAAGALLDTWLQNDFGLSEEAAATISQNAASDQIAQKVESRKRLADEQLNGHGLVPLAIYDGRKHVGTYK